MPRLLFQFGIDAGYSPASSPCTTGWDVSNPKLFGAISIRTMTMAIEARNVAVLAISFTVPSFCSKSEQKRSC